MILSEEQSAKGEDADGGVGGEAAEMPTMEQHIKSRREYGRSRERETLSVRSKLGRYVMVTSSIYGVISLIIMAVGFIGLTYP